MAIEKVKEAAAKTVADVENVLVDVKLKLGEVDHSVHFENLIVHFKAGVAKVEEGVAKELKKLGLIQ